MTLQNDPIERLRTCLTEQLRPLVTADYVLLDCPYHANIGDTLIWEGELAFLKELPYRMLSYGSMSTWGFPRLKPGTVILLHGGGNFGDLWPGVQDFRLRVIEAYPDHPIVIFPQTVYYRDPQRRQQEADRMARHPHVTICARDRRSYEVLQTHFRNRLLLLPDMAFCIPPERLMRYAAQALQADPLWLKRTDQELASEQRPAGLAATVLPHDWPTLERRTLTTWWVYKLSGACDRLSRYVWGRWLARGCARWADTMAFHGLRPENVRIGVRFLTRYGALYTTRLHGAILGILLHKPEVVLIDNNYGKNSSFYETWLQAFPSVRLETANERASTPDPI